MTDRSALVADPIRQLESQLGPQGCRWPEELFLFVSRITPLVNVDLLIQDDDRRTLLTWRDDEYYGPGWHVPGGIIRFRELAADRIRIVAVQELGAKVEFDAAPILVHEGIVRERRNRGHFVSLLYRCRLTSDLDQRRRCSDGTPLPGQWTWHRRCPDDLIREQQAYRALIS